MGQVGLGLIVGVTMLMSDEVVVRMDPKVAEAGGYQVTENLFVKDNTAPNSYREMVYVKAPITNVPFFKNNELDYSRLLWFLGDNARDLSSILFVIMAILVITAVSNGANLTDGLDGQAAGVSAIVITALGILAYLSGNSVAAATASKLSSPSSTGTPASRADPQRPQVGSSASRVVGTRLVAPQCEQPTCNVRFVMPRTWGAGSGFSSA